MEKEIDKGVIVEPKKKEILAQLESKFQMNKKNSGDKSDLYKIRFIDESGLCREVTVPNKKTKPTKKNPKGLSRYNQLNLEGFNDNQFVRLILTETIEGVTQYVDKHGEIKFHDKNRDFLKAIEKSTEELYERNFTDYINKEYSSRIDSFFENNTSGSFDDYIKHLKSLHRQNQKELKMEIE